MKKKPRQTKKAFLWIVSILSIHHIPFQITGGLAAKVYSSKRKLADIDIDIPQKKFREILSETRDYIVFGPGKFKDKNWDLFLMTLNYKGQMIDICSANVKIFNKLTKRWILLRTNFGESEKRKIFGIVVPVIPKVSLIKYKNKLQRQVDKIDVSMMIRK